MDDAEALALKYLEGLSLGGIEYEPDGNIPPDFLIASRVAVEVRRLNQHFGSGDTAEGIEDEQFRMLGKVRGLLKTLGAPITDRTWLFIYRFERPLQDWGTLRPWLVQELRAFLRNPSDAPLTCEMDDAFSFTLVRGTFVPGQSIVLGGYFDRNSGGWAMAEVQRNVKIILAEKAAKVEPYRHRYAEWWLVLVDYIARGLDNDDRRQMQGMIDLLDPWARLIILDPAGRALPWTLVRQ